MQCSRCKNEAVITQTYSGVSLCEAHLLSDIEAKAKKEIRKSGGISSGEKIYFSEKSSAASFALKVFLTKLFEKRMDVSFTDLEEGATSVMLTSSLDDVAADILEKVCAGKADELLKTSGKKIIAPFSVIPSKEIFLYAKYHGWKNFPEKKIEENFSGEIKKFLENFSKTHPSSRYALKNVGDTLPKIYQERSS